MALPCFSYTVYLSCHFDFLSAHEKKLTYNGSLDCHSMRDITTTREFHMHQLITNASENLHIVLR
jgi:hypothetical protein